MHESVGLENSLCDLCFLSSTENTLYEGGAFLQNLCHCGLLVEMSCLSFVSLIRLHRFMLKSQFQKASSLSATLESITLPGRSVFLLERLLLHLLCYLSLNWDQQTSQVIFLFFLSTVTWDKRYIFF